MGDIGRADAHNRQVGVRIVADKNGGNSSAVGECGANFAGAADDVAVGQRVAVWGNEEGRRESVGRSVTEIPVMPTVPDAERTFASMVRT